MIYASFGICTFWKQINIISSDIDRYVFPHANVTYVNSYCYSNLNLNNNSNESTSTKNDTNEYAHSCLDAVKVAVAKDDEHNDTCEGTNSYRLLRARLFS